jgi:hypothetical protein
VQARYRDDPAGFNTDVLRRSPYDPDPTTRQYQREICRSVLRYRTTVVYSGNGIGKDYILGGLIPWWGFTRTSSLVMVTGASHTLVSTVTFKEVRKAVEGSPLLKALGVMVTKGMSASPQQLVFAPGWHALGFSTTNVERASGQHAPELLAIVNEGSGVEDAIYDAVDSWAYRRLLVTGNPLRPDGRMVELINRAAVDARDGVPAERAVNAIRIPSTDSPHARLDRSPLGLADRTWIESTIRQYGADSHWVRTHIHALVPETSADPLLPEAWLDWCAARTRPALPKGHPVLATRRIACDLAEGVGRDSSCVLVRDDWGIVDVTFGSAMGLPEAADLIREKALEHNVPVERITYDRVGIGRDFPLHLARRGLDGCVGYAGAGKPRSTDFRNLRSEAAWRLRQRIDPQYTRGGPGSDKPPFTIPNGPYWPRLRQELKVLTYRIVGRRTSLLDKEDHAIILGHSPDIADALIQSFAFD